MSTQPRESPHPEKEGPSLRKADMPYKPIRKRGEIEDNPVGLSRESCETLVPQLDRHLASYNLLYNQYHKHHWLVVGPQFRDLHLFLEDHYTEVHEHLDAIAERMTVLGGIPTCSPSEQERIAYVSHEPEGMFRIRDMLSLDRECEREVTIELRKTIQAASDLGDFGTKALMEKLLLHAEDRAHHLEHFLEPDTMEIGLTAEEDDLPEEGDA